MSRNAIQFWLNPQSIYDFQGSQASVGRGPCNKDTGETEHGTGFQATTRPYYRSTYVFVTRAREPWGHLTLDDSRLTQASICQSACSWSATME